MAKRLWDKGEELNKQVHDFTVGDDPTVDLHLVRWDLVGSAAHAKMLEKVGLVSKEECQALVKALSDLNKEPDFLIPRELEDCHTTIEDKLTAKLGEVGKKIHTNRSRNDQVLLAMRLFTRSQVAKLADELSKLADSFLKRSLEFAADMMPGYTHMQPAMPATVGMWLEAFSETALGLVREALLLLDILDQNPLGTASGFGTNLPIDREYTAKLLGFSRVQRNPIAVQNSRGQFELKALRLASDIAALIEKFAWDAILYSMREFGFIAIPDAFTTGSSIMPQKKNPDVLELLRARASKVRAAETELSMILAKLPSNYHRDFQYSKEPTVRAFLHIFEMLDVTREVVEALSVNKEKLEAALTPDLYATYDAYREVRGGMSFRDAYRKTAERVKNKSLDMSVLKAEFAPIAKTNEADQRAAEKELAELKKAVATWTARLKQIEDSVFSLTK